MNHKIRKQLELSMQAMALDELHPESRRRLREIAESTVDESVSATQHQKLLDRSDFEASTTLPQELASREFSYVQKYLRDEEGVRQTLTFLDARAEHGYE